MPSRNILKVDIPESFYHVYARGASRQPIFREDDDYRYFLSLFRRYLSEEEIVDNFGTPYAKLHNDIEVLAYCLMGNHFHILLYQHTAGTMARLMRGVMTAYSRYFNKKYDRSGALFESRYKASRVSSGEYLLHISRYIHLNPDRWRDYPYSSLRYYIDEEKSDWLRPQKILELFASREKYFEFTADYKDRRDLFEAIKHELAAY